MVNLTSLASHVVFAAGCQLVQCKWSQLQKHATAKTTLASFSARTYIVKLNAYSYCVMVESVSCYCVCGTSKHYC